MQSKGRTQAAVDLRSLLLLEWVLRHMHDKGGHDAVVDFRGLLHEIEQVHELNNHILDNFPTGLDGPSDTFSARA